MNQIRLTKSIYGIFHNRKQEDANIPPVLQYITTPKKKSAKFPVCVIKELNCFPESSENLQNLKRDYSLYVNAISIVFSSDNFFLHPKRYHVNFKLFTNCHGSWDTL